MIYIHLKADCLFCKRQVDLLGDTLQYVEYVDCGITECDQSISTFPTWALERKGARVKHKLGLLTVSQLLNFAQCFEHTNEKDDKNKNKQY